MKQLLRLVRTGACLVLLFWLFPSGVDAARLRTIGFEVGQGLSSLEGAASAFGTGATVTTDAVTFRSGTHSLKCVSGSGVSDNAYSTISLSSTATATTYYFRAYLNFSGVPTSPERVVTLASTADLAYVWITTSGNLQLFNAASGLQVGSDSTALSTGQWYRVEVAIKINTSTNDDYLELLLDGTSVGSSTTLSIDTVLASLNYRVGPLTTNSVNMTMYADDAAINDSTGSTQNSWPESGKVALLVPTSDNARTGWTAGAGGTTSLFDAVNNSPPIGLASASETNTSQLKDAVSSATDNYDANMTTYTSAGIVASDTVKLVQAVCDQGISGTISARSGALKIVSNPVQSVEDTFAFNQADVGTWPFNWAASWGTTQISPSVTLGTAPVLRVGKRTAVNREVNTDFMGIWVEYSNAVSTSRSYRSLLGVGTK